MPDDFIQVVKATWTESDFDEMGWHDAALHAIAIEPSTPYPGRLKLDIDYIVKWERPMPPAPTFTFWLFPATLVFDQASDLVADLDLCRSTFEPSFDNISRSAPDQHDRRTWTLQGHDFTMTLRGHGFVQYLRRRPTLYGSQRMSLEDRGGISFEEHGFEIHAP